MKTINLDQNIKNKLQQKQLKTVKYPLSTREEIDEKWKSLQRSQSVHTVKEKIPRQHFNP